MHHDGSSSLPADAILRIWLVVSILFLALASVPRSVAVHVPGAWHLVRRRGHFAWAGGVLLLGTWTGYLIVVLQGP